MSHYDSSPPPPPPHDLSLHDLTYLWNQEERKGFRETNVKIKMTKSLHGNVFSQSPLVPHSQPSSILTSFTSSSNRSVFHPLGDQEGGWGDLFETGVLINALTFRDSLSLREKAAELEHQTCIFSIPWGLGLWRADAPIPWEVLRGAGPLGKDTVTMVILDHRENVQGLSAPYWKRQGRLCNAF